MSLSLYFDMFNVMTSYLELGTWTILLKHLRKMLSYTITLD